MSPGQKAAGFLANLKSGGGGGGGGLFGGGGGAPAPAPGPDPALAQRLEALEARLQEVAKAALPPEDGEPPKAPTELMLFLQGRLASLEERLAAAQEEAVRANLLLREREEAQRKAQKEVEDLFRSIREQTRAASWDARLRHEFSAQQQRIAELEAMVGRLQAGSIPAEEVLKAWNDAEGRAELEARLQERAKAASGSEPSSAALGSPLPPRAPSGSEPSSAALGSPLPPRAPSEYTDAQTIAVLMARLADMETRVEAAEKERDQEKARRLMWEKDIMSELSTEPDKFRRSGGSQLVVEAALENAAQTVRERDELAAELSGLLKRIETEPVGSDDLPRLRAALASGQQRLQALQANLEKQAALVQVWLKQRDAPKK